MYILESASKLQRTRYAFRDLDSSFPLEFEESSLFAVFCGKSKCKTEIAISQSTFGAQAVFVCILNCEVARIPHGT